MAFGIKVDKIKYEKHGWYELKPRHLWVGESENDYVVKSKAKRFDSYEEAEEAISEPWEFVEEIKDKA